MKWYAKVFLMLFTFQKRLNKPSVIVIFAKNFRFLKLAHFDSCLRALSQKLFSNCAQVFLHLPPTLQSAFVWHRFLRISVRVVLLPSEWKESKAQVGIMLDMCRCCGDPRKKKKLRGGWDFRLFSDDVCLFHVCTWCAAPIFWNTAKKYINILDFRI